MTATRNIKRNSPVTVTMPTANEWVNPADNPEESNRTIEKLLSESSTSAMPDITFPESDTVSLPGGLARKDTVIRTVEVRELTGEDEESLAKASQSVNPFAFLDRLLRCGVVRIGEEPSSDKDKLLSQMLIGDREAIILGIRRATYGNEIEVKDWQCANCANKVDLTLELDDIPVTKLDDPEDAVFKVKLRKGGFAKVRLANGEDQLSVFEKPDLTQAQRETILLSRCVISITAANGIEKMMAAFPSMSLAMSVPDRHAILKALADNQPGPKYNQVKFECENCKTEQTVTVTIGNLFLDFGWV